MKKTKRRVPSLRVKDTGAAPEENIIAEVSGPKKIWRFIGKHKLLLGLVLAVIAGILIYLYTRPAPAPVRYAVTPVTQQTIVLSVQGTGQVTAVNQLDVKPQASGMVKSIKVKEGDMVKAGQTLAILDQKSAAVALSQAQASLDVAQANYQKLLAGATSADILTSQASVDSAQGSLENAQKSLADVTAQQTLTVNNSYHALLNSGLMNSGISTAGFGAMPSPSNVSSVPPSISGTYFGTDQGAYNITLFKSDQMYFIVSGLESSEGVVNAVSPVPLGTRGLYIQFPSATLSASDSWTITIPNTRASNYLGNLSSYQSALQNQTQSIHNAEASVRNAQASLDQAKAQLALKQEAASPEDIATSKAQISIANSQLDTARLNYSNAVVTAPFDGKVAQVNVQVGDQASGDTSLVTLIGKQLYAEIPLNEIDAAKVKIGQDASMTFDAIDGLSLTGKVTEIQTLGTVTQGVVNYDVKVSFDALDDRVKPGMSVQVAIVTDVRADVLAVPNAALKSQGNEQVVSVIDPSKITSGPTATEVTSSAPPLDRVVQTGITDNSVTEITSGLQAGELVITQTVDASASKTAASASSLRIPGLGGFGGGGR